ncbi:Asp23/Gls24 family envelope stress response protein [Leucobacter sp. BZR 635]
MNANEHRRLLGLGPEDLDGHTIEELSEYLEAGRLPADPLIDESAGCQIALDALERLRNLTPELFAADTAAEPEADELWVQRILTDITLDARAGRRIPIASDAPHFDAGITEGAVRGLIRSSEHAVPGVLLGKCTLDGDVTVIGEPVRVSVEMSVPYGASIPALAERVRGEIRAQLTAHTTLNVTAVDVVIHDIQHIPTQTENGQ